MSRNDSVLVTGMNSASINKASRAMQARAEAKKQKVAKRSVILPAVEPVLEELDKEMNATILAQLDLIDSSTQDFESQALGLKLYKESMKKLRSRLANIMRVSEK